MYQQNLADTLDTTNCPQKCTDSEEDYQTCDNGNFYKKISNGYLFKKKHYEEIPTTVPHPYSTCHGGGGGRSKVRGKRSKVVPLTLHLNHTPL